MTAAPVDPAVPDRAASDAAPLLPTPAPEPADHVTAREIAEFLHHLARIRSPTPGGDPADRAAFLARKAELFTRIADQHTRTAAGPPPSTAPPTPEGHLP